jgi:tetratricopeptide (TPR) repeat protein
LPDALDPSVLDQDVRDQLRALARGIAEQVSLRLVAAGELIDVDPQAALAHAVHARRLASRIAAVREAVGLTAYRAGEWQTAIAELRAYHRMTGRQTHLAVLADCERALGRPERAVDLYRTSERDRLSAEESSELLIVAAGARGDLGQRDAAVAMLQVPDLSAEHPWAARLRYAYADALLSAGRRDEAREWFARAAQIDEDALTDAAERLLDLDGVVLDDSDLNDSDLDETDDTDTDDAEDTEDAGADGTDDTHDTDDGGATDDTVADGTDDTDDTDDGGATDDGGGGTDARGGAGMESTTS